MDYYKKNVVRIKLIPAIIRKNKCNLDELTDLLNEELKEMGHDIVSVRTVSRDLEKLHELSEDNFMITSVKEKIAGKMKSYFVINGNEKTDFLTNEETMMFPILMGLLNTEKEMKTVNWLKNALMLEFGFEHKELDPEPYFVHAQPALNFKEEMLQLTAQIIAYIKKEQAIFFNYLKDGTATVKFIAPLQVRYYDNRYYLLGTEVDENTYEVNSSLKTYSMDKILGKEVFPAIDENDDTEERYIYFEYKKLYERSKLAYLLQHSFGIMYPAFVENLEPRTFRFKFTRWAMGLLQNKKYHASQKIVEEGTDYIIVEMILWDTKEVEFFTDRFRDTCEILG
ncbi:MAG: WYL domain-containing protein [Bacteroidetes bacterium]|nr:WYL domain-containing protein [Bacteroidota bacterium]